MIALTPEPESLESWLKARLSLIPPLICCTQQFINRIQGLPHVTFNLVLILNHLFQYLNLICVEFTRRWGWTSITSPPITSSRPGLGTCHLLIPWGQTLHPPSGSCPTFPSLFFSFVYISTFFWMHYTVSRFLNLGRIFLSLYSPIPGWCEGSLGWVGARGFSSILSYLCMLPTFNIQTCWIVGLHHRDGCPPLCLGGVGPPSCSQVFYYYSFSSI